MKNIKVVRAICIILEGLVPKDYIGVNTVRCEQLNRYVTDRAGYYSRNAVNVTKIAKQLNRMFEETSSTGIKKTTQSYVDCSAWSDRAIDISYQGDQLRLLKV